VNRVTTTPRLLMAAWLGAAVLGLTACGGDDEPSVPSGNGSDSASSSGSAPGTPTTSETTADPTSDPTDGEPSVAAATGAELRQQVSSLHLPEGWEPDAGVVSYQSSATGPRGFGTIGLIDDEALDPGTPLEQRVESAIQTLPKDADVTRLPDVMLGGDTPAYHLTYTQPGRSEVNDLVETDRGERLITITFTLSAKALNQDPALVDSVLASFQWLD
jgi:hypothetical protein